MLVHDLNRNQQLAERSGASRKQPIYKTLALSARAKSDVRELRAQQWPSPGQKIARSFTESAAIALLSPVPLLATSIGPREAWTRYRRLSQPSDRIDRQVKPLTASDFQKI